MHHLHVQPPLSFSLSSLPIFPKFHQPTSHAPATKIPMEFHPPLPQLPTPKSLKNVPSVHPPVFHMDTPERIEIVDRYIRDHGYAIVHPIEDQEEAIAFAKETVKEIWDSVVEDIALRPDLLQRLIAGGFTITDEASLAKFMGSLPPAFLRELYAILGENVFLHSGFGAPASNMSFNLKVIWALRQNKMLDALAQRYLKTDDIKFSLDRPVCLLPGKGEDEFLHLDKQKFTKPDLNMFSGKYCTNMASFICVPESHLWGDEIKEKYEHLYKGSSGQKWGLKNTEIDPMDLFGKTVRLVIPAMTMVLWLPDLIHGVVKHKMDHIAFGLYVGFSKDVERAEYTRVHKKTELHDRFRVYSKGVSPRGFPSIDRVQLYPFRFQNFHARIGDFVAKMDQTSGRYGFAKRKLQKRDVYVPHLVEYDPIDYEPPLLSKRGQEQLVGKKRVREFFGQD